ncbi:hypothetical protein G6L37_06035 [Agrobacterium rubi]|nr:hypothetical protein [Agrobacterium rubi]NTF24920.1 hypothetical protein [Agrobacterium rubi]
METISAEVGTVYVGYADAVAWVSPLPDDALADFIVRMGETPRSDRTLAEFALNLVMAEFQDRTLSSSIVRTGEPTLFDRDPRAITVIEMVLSEMERISGGYAFEQDPVNAQAAVWTAKDIAERCAASHGAADLHAYLRALEDDNDYNFEHAGHFGVISSLAEALAACNIEDTSELRLRYLGFNDGFVTEDAYQELVRTEGRMREAVSSAAQDHWRRFRDACGRFDYGKARESYEETCDARYYDRPRNVENESIRAQQAIAHAEHSVKLARNAEFRKQEREKGYSPYGYWFAPDGTVHAMNGFQIHDTWIRGKSDGGPGLADRYEALADGWVSMTMMDEKSPGANIAYGEGVDCQKALKAAARIVRRGGEFSSVVIEAYDGMEPAGYEFHDDIRFAARRLNEIVGGNLQMPAVR